MKIIKDIIAKLDIVLAQVLIEAAVISVTLTDSRDLGISYLQHPAEGRATGPASGPSTTTTTSRPIISLDQRR